MAMESHGQPLPPVLDRAAITPPPSFPLLLSDPFPFSPFDIHGYESLENADELFGPGPSLDVPLSEQSHIQPPSRQPSVARSAPSPTQTSLVLLPSPSSRPPSPQSSQAAMSSMPGSRVWDCVDLTTQFSPTAAIPRPNKRPAASQETSSTGSGSKRIRASDVAPEQERPAQNGAIAEDDLPSESDRALSRTLQKQLEEQVRGQEKKKEELPTLSALQCIICLEVPTDLTVTACGHLFCYACLMPALYASEPSKSRCPVCRRSVNRVKRAGKPLDYQPLELKLTTRSSKGKETARE